MQLSIAIHQINRQEIKRSISPIRAYVSETILGQQSHNSVKLNKINVWNLYYQLHKYLFCISMNTTRVPTAIFMKRLTFSQCFQIVATQCTYHYQLKKALEIVMIFFLLLIERAVTIYTQIWKKTLQCNWSTWMCALTRFNNCQSRIEAKSFK